MDGHRGGGLADQGVDALDLEDLGEGAAEVGVEGEVGGGEVGEGFGGRGGHLVCGRVGCCFRAVASRGSWGQKVRVSAGP